MLPQTGRRPIPGVPPASRSREVSDTTATRRTCWTPRRLRLTLPLGTRSSRFSRHAAAVRKRHRIFRPPSCRRPCALRPNTAWSCSTSGSAKARNSSKASKAVAAGLSWIVENADLYGGNVYEIVPVGYGDAGSNLFDALLAGHAGLSYDNIAGLVFVSASLGVREGGDAGPKSTKAYRDSHSNHIGLVEERRFRCQSAEREHEEDFLRCRALPPYGRAREARQRCFGIRSRRLQRNPTRTVAATDQPVGCARSPLTAHLHFQARKPSNRRLQPRKAPLTKNPNDQEAFLRSFAQLHLSFLHSKTGASCAASLRIIGRPRRKPWTLVAPMLRSVSSS